MYYISNAKGRAHDVFLPQMERFYPRGGIGTKPLAAPDVEPDPVHAPCSCAERSQMEAKSQGSSFLERQFVHVSREALHRLQGTRNLADLHSDLSVPALRGGRFSVPTWSESVMSTDR